MTTNGGYSPTGPEPVSDDSVKANADPEVPAYPKPWVKAEDADNA